MVMVCGCRSASVPKTATPVGRPPAIRPDYRNCVIPPNIAPLNFIVAEEGQQVRARIWSDNGSPIVVGRGDGKVVIPLRPWRELLQANLGNDLKIDVYVLRDGQGWRQYETITNRIAPEPVDSHVAYRLIGPVHNLYQEMSIRQRHIESFQQRTLLSSSRLQSHCMNCHTFIQNRPDTMIMHVRAGALNRTGMILLRDGQATMVDTRTPNNSSPASYTSWHPSGRLAAFSANKLAPHHHLSGRSQSVIDRNSDLGIYVAADSSVRSAGVIADPDFLETFPRWSWDGKYLYFSRARRTWDLNSADEVVPILDKNAPRYGVPDGYEMFRYDLARVAYDVESDAWGEVETVLSARKFGKSISEARPSPDGRFVLFTATGSGTFPVFNDDADLWMLELATGKTWPLAANSDLCDSWHGWSTNGRWVIFASKRTNGLLSRIYFTHIDADGRSHKPVALPQEDPAFDESFLKSYNAPELITGWVNISSEDLLSQTIMGADIPAAVDAVSGATSLMPTSSERPSE
jgi:hypothetical protein